MKRNRKIESMLQEIRDRGGIVGLSDRIADAEAEFFLEQVLYCPDCEEWAERAGHIPPSRTEH